MSEFASESLQIVDNQKNNEINIIETLKKKRGRPKKEKNDKVVKTKNPEEDLVRKMLLIMVMIQSKYFLKRNPLLGKKENAEDLQREM